MRYCGGKGGGGEGWALFFLWGVLGGGGAREGEGRGVCVPWGVAPPLGTSKRDGVLEQARLPNFKKKDFPLVLEAERRFPAEQSLGGCLEFQNGTKTATEETINQRPSPPRPRKESAVASRLKAPQSPVKKAKGV